MPSAKGVETQDINEVTGFQPMRIVEMDAFVSEKTGAPYIRGQSKVMSGDQAGSYVQVMEGWFHGKAASGREYDMRPKLFAFIESVGLGQRTNEGMKFHKIIREDEDDASTVDFTKLAWQCRDRAFEARCGMTKEDGKYPARAEIKGGYKQLVDPDTQQPWEQPVPRPYQGPPTTEDVQLDDDIDISDEGDIE